MLGAFPASVRFGSRFYLLFTQDRKQRGTTQASPAPAVSGKGGLRPGRMQAALLPLPACAIFG